MGQYSCNGEEYDLYDYLALGDSITKGYALPDPDAQCYASLFAREYGFNFKNYGELGLTAEELLTAIQADMYPVSEPKVITISAGVNDVLAPILKTLAVTIDLDSRVGVSIITVNDRLKELFVTEPHERVRFRIENAIKAVNDNMRLERICDELTEVTIPKIAREIKKRNPDVQIIITNIYNPYKSKAVFRGADGSVQTLDMTELFSFYAKRVNNSLANSKNIVGSQDFVIADLDTFLTGSEFVNTIVSSEDIESITLDPHPTVEGHMLIKTAIDKVYIPK